MKMILIGGAAVAAMTMLPIWRYPDECRGLTGLEALWRELIIKKRVTHIPVAEAVANARRRYEMGIMPSHCRS